MIIIRPIGIVVVNSFTIPILDEKKYIPFDHEDTFAVLRWNLPFVTQDKKLPFSLIFLSKYEFSRPRSNLDNI